MATKTLDGNTPAAPLDGTETSSCIQGTDKTFTFNQVKTFVNAADGTAATKNATDNTKSNVASVTGSFVAGNFMKAADTAGTAQDSGAAPSALTKVDDTNVTLTLGGTPATALLQAASLTLGWTGQLSSTRGGTGVNNGGNTLTFGGTINFANAFATVGAFGVTQTYTGSTSVTFPTTGTLATTSQLPTPAALTKTDDTNVTLTLGGSASTALLQATSITAGWTGQLSSARGGTGVNNGSNTITLGGNISTANSFTTSGNFPVTHTYTGSTNVTFPTSGTLATTAQVPSGAALTKVDDTNVTMTLGGTPGTAVLQATSLSLGWTGFLGGTRGGTGVNNGANTATYAGNLNFANSFTTSGNFPVTLTYTGSTNVTFPTSGTLATTAQIPSGAALTKTDDTNVTLTLGGSSSTALVNAASLTLGWTGVLSSARGGTGVNNGSNTITLGGNISTANSFTTSGNFPATHTYTGSTNVTFPTSGTLAVAGQSIGTTLTSSTTLTSGQNGQTIPVNFTTAGTITVPKQATTALTAGYSVDLLNIGLTDVQLNHEAGDVFEAQSYLLGPGASMRVYLKAAGTPNTWEAVGGTYEIPISYNWSPFGTVTNATYKICNAVESDFVITDLYFVCTSGSSVGTVSSTTGNLTAFSFSSTSSTLAITTNSSITQGSDLTIVISSSSSLVNPALTVRGYKRFNL